MYLYVKYPLICYQILTKLGMFPQSLLNLNKVKFHENPFKTVELFHAHVRTDGAVSVDLFSWNAFWEMSVMYAIRWRRAYRKLCPLALRNAELRPNFNTFSFCYRCSAQNRLV
jgi:hypothetical protein